MVISLMIIQSEKYYCWYSDWPGKSLQGISNFDLIQYNLNLLN